MKTISDSLLDRHRDINVDDTWWDSVLENWIEKLDGLGLNLSPSDIQFSGFCSQGDGASFTCTIRVAEFMEQHGLAEQYPGAYYCAKKGWIEAMMMRGPSNYCHENTVFPHVGFYSAEIDYAAAEEGELRAMVDLTMAERFAEDERDGFGDDIMDTCRGYMRGIYSDLEKEHDYLTSDEQVRETLEANGMYDEEEDEEEDVQEVT